MSRDVTIDEFIGVLMLKWRMDENEINTGHGTVFQSTTNNL